MQVRVITEYSEFTDEAINRKNMPTELWKRGFLVERILESYQDGLSVIFWNPYVKSAYVSDDGMFPFDGIDQLSMDVRDQLYQEGYWFSKADLLRKRLVTTVSASDFLNPNYTPSKKINSLTF